jgi:hypothetical protein
VSEIRAVGNPDKLKWVSGTHTEHDAESKEETS